MFSIFGFIYKEINKKKVARKFRTREILLSFDDGPDSRYTDALLDLLREKNVQAVFFVVAEKAAQHPEIISRMKEEGHRIEYHSPDHRKFFYIGTRRAEEYLRRGIKLLTQQGVTISYFRPPWGMLTPFYLRVVKRLGLKLCFWSTMVQDWRAASTVHDLKYKLFTRTINGSLICLHDSGEGTGGAPDAPARMIEALSEYIDNRKSCGYKFLSFEEARERGLIL